MLFCFTISSFLCGQQIPADNQRVNFDEFSNLPILVFEVLEFYASAAIAYLFDMTSLVLVQRGDTGDYSYLLMGDCRGGRV